jgi:hypothetical protein
MLKNIILPKNCKSINSICISGCENIQNLDLSTCDKLRTITIDGYAAFCSLRLPANKKTLNSIYLWNLGISELDISGYTNLEVINIRSCNRIKKLNTDGDIMLNTLRLTDMPNLQVPNFNSFQRLESLYVLKCQLITIIDVSGCAQMEIIESDDNTKTVNLQHGNIEISHNSSEAFKNLLRSARDAKKAEKTAKAAKQPVKK